MLRMIAAPLAAVGATSLLGACQRPVPPPAARPDSRPTLVPLQTPEGTPERTPIPAIKASPAVTPRRGGSVVWAAEASPTSLDPHKTSDLSSIRAWGDLVYQSLTMFDENMRVVPALAESWTSRDSTTWMFRLRQGVRFHDGSELEAQDVVFWHERLTAPATAAPDRSRFDAIRKVEARDRYTVEMTLAAPHAPLLGAFAALHGSAIVPRRWAANSDLTRQAIGTGPFRIVEHVPRSHIRYARHADYWERGLPYLDDVRVELVADEAARIAGLRSGRFRYATVRARAARPLVDLGDVRVLNGPGSRTYRHVFNVGQRPFDDVRVRQAVALTVDRQAAIGRALDGQGALTGPIPTGLGAWSIPPDRLPYRRNFARALELLGEAGYPEGFRTTILAATDDPTVLATTEVLAEQLREIDVEVEVRQLPRGDVLRQVQARTFEIYADATDFLPDPDDYLAPYRSAAPSNSSRYGNARFDELVDQARTVLEPPERKRLYDDAQAILLTEVPALWWFAENHVEALHTGQRGYAQSLTGRRTFLKQAWLE